MKKNKYHQKIQAKVFEARKSSFFSVLVIVLAFFIGVYGYRCLFEKVCYASSVDTFVRHSRVIKTPHDSIVVEFADTKSSRELGLSGRKGLEEGKGMLFVFDTPGRYGFWMKDMSFSLDILWINEDGIVVEIERAVTPQSYPKTYINASPAKYVLEVNAGEAEKRGLFIGSKVKIIE